MAQVSSPQIQYATMPSRMDDSMGSAVFAQRPSAPIAPEPLPHFVFPFQSPRTPTDNFGFPSSSSGNAETLGSRRTANRSRPPQRISISNLPQFEFHPATDNSNSSASGPSSHSPAKSLPIPSRVGGHRRGGSEYIGGDGTATGPGLMSTSPTKGEGSLPPVSNSRRGPPGSRRGHAHRRSGAISNHDLSSIIRPTGELNSPTSGSAPASPSDPDAQLEFLPILDRSASQPVVPPSNSSPPRQTRRESLTINGQARPRVGFSETVEFIPRPLSTISSETSSSLSTIRASHSVTGSITSIISGSASSPPPAVKSEVIPEDPMEYNPGRTRPKSAGCILDNVRTTKVPLEKPVLGGEIPSSKANAMSNTAEVDNLGFPRLGRRPIVTSQTRVNNLAAQYAGSFLNDDPCYTIPSDSDNIRRLRGEQAAQLPASRPRSSPEPKVTKRQKRGKSWAGSFLSRKGRSRSSVAESDPQDGPVTTVLQEIAPMDDISLADMNLDEDTTFTIRDPRYTAPRPARTDFSTWEPRKPISFQDAQSPVIDIDAALAPLHTPSSSEDGDANSQGGFSSAKRRMHSGGAIGGFTGPGMHYHRRAESAPEMAPVDYMTFSLPHLGSNNSMADVFEEEEEDEAASRAGNKNVGSELTSSNAELQGLGVQIVDAELGVPVISRHGSRHDRVQSVNVRVNTATIVGEPQGPTTPLTAEPAQDDIVPVEVVDPHDEPRFSVVTKSSDDSTVTPTVSADPLRNGSLSASLDFGFPRLSQYIEMPETPSSMSSPDLANTSFDDPRLHTATSSITDRTAWSGSRAGGVGQGSTYSSEDVPSLTSSASTVISSYPPRASTTSAGTRSSGERAASFSAAVPPRVRPVSAGKRASLASLSRLVGSSYGEKSKLSIESRAQSEDADRSDKKKGNRISRLMRLWKPKEKITS